MATQWILLVIEDGIFAHEGTCYAIKLAKRMSCAISVLMLSENTALDSAKQRRMKEALEQTLAMITAEGLIAEAAIGYGDKASECLKHLAVLPSLSTIVLASDRTAGDSKHKRKRNEHWFSKIKSAVVCPVIRPKRKPKTEHTRTGSGVTRSLS